MKELRRLKGKAIHVHISDCDGKKHGDGKGRITKDVWHNGSLDIAAGPDGTIHAVWTDYEGALWLTRSACLHATSPPGWNTTLTTTGDPIRSRWAPTPMSKSEAC